MRTYLLNVQEPYKTFILNWQKIFEWRLNKWKFAEMQVWDILEFENTKEKFEIISKNAVNNVYYKFYSPEDEKRFWVVAIEIKKI